MKDSTPTARRWRRVPAVVLAAIVASAGFSCGGNAAATSTTLPSLQSATVAAEGSQGGFVRIDATLVAMNRGLPIPESNRTLDKVPEFDTVVAACAAAVVAEVENIALYDELLALDLPRDVRNVFTNIRAASLNNHLPAFEACCACAQ